MIGHLIRRGRIHAKRTLEVDAQRERVEAQWPEVREGSAWARGVRQHNHLTELFNNSRMRGSHG